MSSAERQRSLGQVLRTLFSRRSDPYFGTDRHNARRLGGLMSIIYGTVAALLLPLAPPTGEHAVATWLVAGAIVAWSFLTARHLLRSPNVSFNSLLAGSYLALAQLVTLQALAGSGASAVRPRARGRRPVHHRGHRLHGDPDRGDQSGDC